MVILIIGFQILRLFVWHMEFVKEETLSFRFISDLFLHSSINLCAVNGRDAMAAHS